MEDTLLILSHRLQRLGDKTTCLLVFLCCVAIQVEFTVQNIVLNLAVIGLALGLASYSKDLAIRENSVFLLWVCLLTQNYLTQNETFFHIFIVSAYVLDFTDLNLNKVSLVVLNLLLPMYGFSRGLLILFIVLKKLVFDSTAISLEQVFNKTEDMLAINYSGKPYLNKSLKAFIQANPEFLTKTFNYEAITISLKDLINCTNRQISTLSRQITFNTQTYDITFETIILEEARTFVVSIRKSDRMNIYRVMSTVSKLIHDFKTPLHSITGMISTFNPRNTQSLETLSELGSYVQFLSYDLQKYIHETFRLTSSDDTRLEITKFRLKSYQRFLYVVLKNMINSNSIKRRQIEVKCFTVNTPKNMQLKTDKNVLSQILLNIIGNAYKFTKEGLIQICIRNYCTEEEEFISFEIEDTGVGMDDIQKAQCFTEFSKGTTAGNTNGTGLGLNIAKSKAEKLGFNLSFESEQGKGTKFTLEIPKINEISGEVNFVNYSESVRSTPNTENVVSSSKFRHSNSFVIPLKKKSSDISFITEEISNDRNESILFGCSEKKDTGKTTTKMSFIAPNMKEILEESSCHVSVQSFNERTILVIDDQEEMRRSLANSIKDVVKEWEDEFSYKVKTGLDGVDLLKMVFDAAYRGEHIEAVFLDLNMTYMDGDHSVTVMKEIGLRIPQIVYTSVDALPDGSLSIPKPCKKEILKDMLQTIREDNSE